MLRKYVCKTHCDDGVGCMYACMYVRIYVHKQKRRKRHSLQRYATRIMFPKKGKRGGKEKTQD